MPVIRRVPQDYASVAVAHAAAGSGDIIYITGKYTEAIEITKAVHLVGAGGLTDTDFSITTANGLVADNASHVVSYNLSSTEAAKVPFLLAENLFVQNTVSAGSANSSTVRFKGTSPVGGIVFNRCLLARRNYNFLEVDTSGFVLNFDRCRFLITESAPRLADYNAAIAEGNLCKCVLATALSATDLAQNWLVKDYVTTPTTGYGVVPTDGIALRWEDLDFEAYRIYGTVTDIPTFVDPSEFEIRLYPERTPQGNDMGFGPLEMIPLSLIETVDNKWSGSWEFKYLLPTRRYGILINPPDGMQGHWLRWYNPAVE